MNENDLLVDYPEFARTIDSREGQTHVLDTVVGEEEGQRAAKVLARCTAVLLHDIETAENDESLFEDVSTSILVVFLFGIWLGQRGLAKL